ncbi:hypothetical protein GCM10025876_12750 [Demequina litorisediminis]|uniref:protein acetyllysine N-acetyltransferase n=1 Tax=Demequina litorisediminis TaxID=1849022 RepID=A0ABQ6ICT5_9MICO|nr:hypothetical protein GCM10025876_12750 [Demequina litorisediminis]
MTTDDAPAPHLSAAHTLIAGRTLAVLTGAGLSTDSGIPDYRGANSPRRTPMTFQDFVSDEAHRRRYWVGSHLGWRAFAGTQPNPGHTALAALEAAGLVTGLITQNVDGLHLRAGSQRVVELHGHMRSVVCLACHTEFSRDEIAGRLERDNPALAVPDAVEPWPRRRCPAPVVAARQRARLRRVRRHPQARRGVLRRAWSPRRGLAPPRPSSTRPRRSWSRVRRSP